MKICIAQTRPLKGDVSANLRGHKTMLLLAASCGAEGVFFPELSITGYEPELAGDLATTQDDPRFDEMQQISDAHKITIGAGVPIRSGSGTLISMIVFAPGAPRQVYSKQLLHADELPYFVCGKGQSLLTIGNKKLAPAICYESLQAEHSEEAARLGAEIYVASVAKPEAGVERASAHFPLVAKRFNIPVLMANCIGPCDNFESIGKSSVWTKNGALLAQLDEEREGLLVFDTETESVVEHLL